MVQHSLSLRDYDCRLGYHSGILDLALYYGLLRLDQHDLRSDPVELDDARWVSREAVLAAHMGIHPDITAARPGAVARFVMDRWLADDLRPGGAA